MYHFFKILVNFKIFINTFQISLYYKKFRDLLFKYFYFTFIKNLN